MKHFLKRIKATGLSVTLASVAIGGGLAVPVFATNSSSTDPSTYIASLHPLNRSGVTGFANLSLNDTQPGAALQANVNARGTEPNQIHAIHIHGKLDGGNAECPSPRADVNKDRFVSVFEGAPFYGPIKVNFTSPATAFGTPANNVLFAPFAGTPVFTNFPRSNSAGRVSYSQTIPFDASNQFAVDALASIQPLEDQHIVIHGGFAPENVDTAGGNPNKIVYDALLPVACGQISQTHRGSIMNNQNNNQGNVNGANGRGSSNVTINDTGSGSTNRVDIRNNNRIESTNTNKVMVNNSNNQRSESGWVKLSRNTRTANATSGDATNDSSITSLVQLMNSSLGMR